MAGVGGSGAPNGVDAELLPELAPELNVVHRPYRIHSGRAYASPWRPAGRREGCHRSLG